MAQHVFDSVDEVLHHLADFFVEQAHQAVAARGRFTVALSGGSSPKKLYELLASAAYRERVPWAQVFFFFGDERNVPATDPQSNYLMAKTALLAPLSISGAQVFPVDTSLPPKEAAAAYTKSINEFFGSEPAQFDLVLLGLGDNSHTASLFPHTAVLHATTASTEAVFVEELKADRITLTATLINQAHAVAFLVFGADKAAAVRRVLVGERNIEEYPAQLINPTEGEAHWFLDTAAASEL
jgi:6-phosphogluconolactonase